MENKYLLKSFKETETSYVMDMIVLDENGNYLTELPIMKSKAEVSKEILNNLILKNEAEVKRVLGTEKDNDVKKEIKKEKKVNVSKNKRIKYVSAFLLGAIIVTGIKLSKDNPEWFGTKKVNNDLSNNPSVEEPSVEEPAPVVVEIVTVEEQKKFYEEIDLETFKENVDKIIEEYAENGFEADYKGVSSTLFFANMQSINPEVVISLIEEEYLESDFTQNMQSLLNFDSKVRHLNNLYTTNEGDRFISLAPMAISNQKDNENILYSEELLKNIKTSEDAESKFKYLDEYRNHISGPEVDTNYEHGYDDLTIGYRVLNRRFLAPVFDFATTNYVDEVYRGYLNDYSTNISEIVGFMNKFEGCFDNVPKTK